MYFVYADHLNTPRLVANQQGQSVWRWEQQESTTSNTLAVYRKTAAAGEPASHAFAIAGGTFLVGGIQAFSGADPANPSDVESGKITVSGANHDPPSVTRPPTSGSSGSPRPFDLHAVTRAA